MATEAAENYLQDTSVIAADWMGFVALFGSAVVLTWKLMSFRGPEHDDVYFMGYREEKMLSVFVNLFAAIAYWARLCSHANGDVGPAAQIVTYKYIDYLLTCPILTVDLMWSLNLPYKFTYGASVGVCIVCAFACSTLDGMARYMWFAMGISLFGATWVSIVKVVRMRLDQFTSKAAKKVRTSLKIACMTYFAIWGGYPTLWVLNEAGIVDPISSHVLHCFLDVLAKSVYGFALLSFVLHGEKQEFIFLPLKPACEPKPSARDDEDEEDSEDEDSRKPGKQAVMIGSKINSRPTHSNEKPHQPVFLGGSIPMQQPRPDLELSMGGMTNQHPDVTDTRQQILDLNSQIASLMAQQQQGTQPGN
mmetsp:Transcript_8985/g.14198  ORF Transcript_8985/g.14198 Transcript_8985/m.14198 type:complete len:362 (-) Transcript_8985:188-1273(-)|eukprot:CAMPEP_0184325970 /NCGR_PEP_ID=MMETSP1049-20130417/142315_1 /TAXON_ID=77928 /ORGANISM="Proteomonas sulcata, Strain CCMP704" /LENGTH=361 /DNA_ID=CAMNT_0026648137 /DNA_START=156 /DNA_END=1241 /DNA_ORIENTATION=+